MRLIQFINVEKFNINYMKVYTIDTSKRKVIYDKLYDALKRDEILFVYVYGSFTLGIFRDIDIGVYLRNFKNKEDIIKYETTLESELEYTVGFPVDVRILNYAPLSFRFNVIKNGKLLFSKDESERSNFECLTFVEFHDFKFHRDSYRREAIGIENTKAREMLSGYSNS